MLTKVMYHGFTPSPELFEHVRGRVEDLATSFARIVSCKVAVELPHRHQRHGRRFRVRIDVMVPGAEIAVGRAGAAGPHDDPFVAVRDAFTAIRRSLTERGRRHREQHRGKRLH